ncbi:MAG: hypothetical protein IJO67_08315 [Clostridia bacterium]|nr:hypothetical protein [Clostridia bacterium]MBR6753885.1 hypothetical protein [Clostridia bacterium]
MRCGCPECGSFMIHSESDHACVCPDCLARCYACQGTGTALSREEILGMKRMMEIKTTDERIRDAQKRDE